MPLSAKRSTTSFTAVCLAALSLSALACGKGDSSAPTPAQATVAPAATTPAAAATPTPTHAASAVPAPASTASAGTVAVHVALGNFTNIPTTRSKVPTIAEWGAASDIKGVPGNGGDLSECEVRNVREWIRITCRAFGGQQTGTALPRVTPDSATVLKGKDGDTFTFAQGDVASVVWPMVDGKSRQAKITYGDAFPAKLITLDYPHGAPDATLKFSK